MIHWWYENRLKKHLEVLPSHICFMIAGDDMADAPHKIYEVTKWCREMGIGAVTFHVNISNSAVVNTYLPAIRQIGSIALLTLHYGDTSEMIGDGIPVTVAIGKSGQEEICEVIRRMARDGIDPDDVDELMIESYLTFPCEPDLVIKTGGQHLVDFFIWQSVYSELFFSDVNWSLFRKVDFLRALRDYQFRSRRFGR